MQKLTIVMRRDLALAAHAMFNNPSWPLICCLGEKRNKLQQSDNNCFLNLLQSDDDFVTIGKRLSNEA